MAWIESHQGLARHIKTKRLARKLKISIPATIGHLHLLWWWAMDNLPDGRLTALEPEDIADEMMWNDDPNDLMDALEDTGFVDREGDELYIHDWHDYIGRLLERRKKETDRKREYRKKSESRPAGQPMDETRDGGGNSTVPYLTIPKDIKTTPKKKKDTYPELFEQFWNTYPRRVEKSNALAKWNAQINKKEDPQQIITSAYNYMVYVSAEGTETKYMKHPKTFLNGDTWKEFINPIVAQHLKQKEFNSFSVGRAEDQPGFEAAPPPPMN